MKRAMVLSFVLSVAMVGVVYAYPSNDAKSDQGVGAPIASNVTGGDGVLSAEKIRQDATQAP